MKESRSWRAGRRRCRWAAPWLGLALWAQAATVTAGVGVPAVGVRAILREPQVIELHWPAAPPPLAPQDVRVELGTRPWFSLLRRPVSLDGLFLPVTVRELRTEQRGEESITIVELGPYPQLAPSLASVPWYTASYATGNLERDIRQADNLLSWQLYGGWSKGMEERYRRPWDGKEPRSTVFSVDGKRTELATIDNDSTTNELLFLAHMYRQTHFERYREGVRRAIDFLLAMQYPSGGWPQVYPRRGNYSDYVTFNDDAMIRVMAVLRLAAQGGYPFDTDVVDGERRARIEAALQRGLDFILRAQIRINGVLTAWCAQHDPITYEPREGRSYEHPSISGSESVGILAYLISLPNPSPAVRTAISTALAWFEAAQVKDTRYVNRDPQERYFYREPGSVIWYRFYDLATNEPIFSGRDGVIKRDIRQIEKERREGYAWATTRPKNLLDAVRAVGYFDTGLFITLPPLPGADGPARIPVEPRPPAQP